MRVDFYLIINFGIFMSNIKKWAWSRIPLEMTSRKLRKAAFEIFGFIAQK